MLEFYTLSAIAGFCFGVGNILFITLTTLAYFFIAFLIKKLVALTKMFTKTKNKKIKTDNKSKK